MDPTLLQHSTPFDFPISSESKYIGQERQYSNSSYPANDYSFPSRRPQSSLTNGSTGTGVALPANSGLEFNGSSLLSETAPYHSNSQLLLSPPDSTSGSGSASCQPTSSSIPYTTLPKPFLSNAGSADHFSSAPPSVLSSNWPGSSMTSMDRPPRFQPLSPPLTHYPSSNGIGHFLSNRSMGDRLAPSYPSNGQAISPGLFHNTRGYTSGPFQRTNLGHAYAVPESSYQMSSAYAESASTGQQGPPFGETCIHISVSNNHHQQLHPEISASIQKGFFQVDRKWTCYRRNYFAVTCSFTFKNPMAEGPFYLNRGSQREPIQQFAVSISAKTASPPNQGESETRGLVQHTPKRDKATETVPSRHQISPTPNQTVGNNGIFPSSNSLYGGAHHLPPTMMGVFAGFDNPGANAIPTTHTFERIQFQKATANNGKRRAQQQYFLVVVELSANIGRSHVEENWVVFATKESDPMVVRGRSPGHYKDNGRRDSQTSMDPDRGGGAGADGQAGSLAPYRGHGGHGHSGMDWQSNHRHSGAYGGNSYRQAVKAEFSPTSMASSSTLTGTPTEAEPSLSDSHTAKSSCTFSSDQSALTPLSDDSDEPLFGMDRHIVGRKRPYEEEDEEEQLGYHHIGLFTDSVSALADLSAVPYSKLLCASS